MTTVKDGITWLLYEPELKAYLGVLDATEDVRLELWLDQACASADQYIDVDLALVSDQNPLGVEPDFDVRPWSAIKFGVFEWVRIIREGYTRAFGLTSAKTEDLSEVYAVGTRIRGGEITADLATDSVTESWLPFKDIVIL